MTRYISIETCRTCPHNDHKGGFGRVAYLPVCRLASRDLPYTSGVNGQPGRERIVATPTGEIPEWCPLPLLEK